MEIFNKFIIPIFCIAISCLIVWKLIIRKDDLNKNDTLKKEKEHETRVFYVFCVIMFLLPIGFSYAPEKIQFANYSFELRVHWGIVCIIIDLIFFFIFVYPKLLEREEQEKMNRNNH